MNLWTQLKQLSSPQRFHRLAELVGSWMGLLCVPLLGYGLVGGLLLAPPDYQQGEGYRIIYVHVPAAWMSLMLYTGMAVAGGIALIWRVKAWECLLVACAPVGASLTALALVTGMLWGKPMWGTYWVWDARLTSELVLLFLYAGVILLHQSISDARTAARACALLALVGVVNVPIVHYSVQWWNTLHQGSILPKIGKPTLDATMLWPLLAMALGYLCFSVYAVLRRAQNELIWRERESEWVRELRRG